MRSHQCCQAEQPHTDKHASIAELTLLELEGYTPTL